MEKHLVSVCRYEKPFESTRKAVELCEGLDLFKKGSRVFIKPNIVFWTTEVEFPKYGVITTSRTIHDMIVILKDSGIDDITIIEGSVALDPKKTDVKSAHAYKTLGYHELARRYGVKTMNVFERPFKTIDFGKDVLLKMNADILDSDLVVDIPVMKTHVQTHVSLGIKNLKGLIDLNSRKTCHNPDPKKDLHFHVARLSDNMPPVFCLVDGIYTAELGPNVDGRMHRSNLLVGSKDLFSADKVGAMLLGHAPGGVPHLSHYAKNHHRPTDLSDVEVVGETITDLAKYHEPFFPWTDDHEMPAAWKKFGFEGLAYRRYDLTVCTYCAEVTGNLLAAIMKAWKGKPWDDVELLTGKTMLADPRKKHSILLGKCVSQANKNNTKARHLIPIKGCPPRQDQIIKAFHEAGIDIDPRIIENVEKWPGFFMKRYEGNPDFNPGHFEVHG
jgi:uncharacterized protein (DUF362 family)